MDFDFGFGVPSSFALAPKPVFSLFPSSIGSDGTFIRATIATVKDHEGVIREVLSGEVRYQGQRRVHNLNSDSENIASAVALNMVADNAETLRVTVASTVSRATVPVLSTTKGTELVFSIELEDVSMTQNPYIWIAKAGGGDDGIKVECDVTNGIKRFITSHTTLVDGDYNLHLYLAPVVGGNSTIGDQLKVRFWMNQDKTGASDPTIPDSYVSTGVLSSPYHGANVDGVEYSLKTNGNSVLNNVVTEANGSAITGSIGYFGEIASTNVLLQNRDFGNAVWLKTNAPTETQDQIGIDGKENTAWTLDDSSASAASHYQTITIINDGTTHSAHIYILKDEDETRFPEVDILLFGGSLQEISTQLNTKTGAIINRISTGTLSSSVEQITINGVVWWKLTQTIKNNTSGNTSLRFRIYSAITTVFNTFDAAATGSIVVDAPQIELNKAFTTSPIFTTTAAVARNKDDLLYPTTNIPVNDCVFDFDWIPTANNQLTFILTGIYFGGVDNFVIYISGNTSLIAWKVVSGTTYQATKTISYVAGVRYKVKVRFSSTRGIDIWFDDSKGTGNPNTSDMLHGPELRIGRWNVSSNLQQTGGIDNFKVYQGNFTDKEVVNL